MKDIIVEIINEIKVGKGQVRILLQDVSEDTDLRNDLGLDSLELAVLTVRLEDITNVDIFENGVITTIGEILFQLENSK